MTDREKFEGEISAPPYEKSVSRWANDPVKHGWPGGYKDIAVDLAWCMWQASRKQMAEEAAAVCMKYAARAKYASELFHTRGESLLEWRAKEAAGVTLAHRFSAIAAPHGLPRPATDEEDSILRATTRDSAVLVAKGRLATPTEGKT